MAADFYRSLSKGNAGRESREFHLHWVLREPDLLPALFAYALDVKDKNHHKACWILELVAEADIALFVPHLDDFCKGLPVWQHPGAERAGARISHFLADKHLECTKSGVDFLSPSQFDAIVENAFDRLASPDTLVAAKALLMRALFKCGNLDDWIHPELKEILEKDFASHSPAYKGAAREVLGWLARANR